MATVYQATDTRLHVERAVKILSPELARSAKLMERFEREARVMAKLEHPNIVPVHDVGRDGATVYLVMSLFQAGSLDDHLLNVGPLPPHDAVKATHGVVLALKAAHASGIIHRDVKAQNVLIDSHGNPRLCDFGIAHVSTDRRLTGTGAQLGTWAFMAPEQRAGQSIDERVDVYAVGAMLLMLVTGEIPNDLHATDAHDGQFKGVPDALRAVIVRATRFHPRDRHDGATELLADLDTLLATLPDTPPMRLGRTLAVDNRTPTNDTLVGWDQDHTSAHDSISHELVTQQPAPDSPPTLAGREDLQRLTTTSGWMARGMGALVIGFLTLTLLVIGGSFAGWAAWSSMADSTATASESEGPDLSIAEPEPGLPTPEPIAIPTPDTRPEPAAQPRPQPVVEPQPIAQPQPTEQVLATPSPDPAPTDTPPIVLEQPPEPQPQVDVPVALPGYGVTITSIPWSTVTIDGTSKGTTLWTDELPSGQYTVRLQAADYPDLIRVVTVADGPLAFCWDFSEQAVCAR